jgi:glutathione synthase/RimK-type ligase-like ATP-grasp enzyme
MRKGRSQTVYSKWTKHSALLKNRRITRYLPQTVSLNKNSLQAMVKKHSCVYIKPVLGSLGKGVFRIKQVDDQYELRYKKEKVVLNDGEALYREVEHLIRGKKYLVQQGIRMIEIKDRPIDFRILMQRPRHKWQLMGVMGRWAIPNMVITNLASGGKPIHLRVALTRSLRYDRRQLIKMERRLVKISSIIAHTLRKKFPGMREVGIDVAIDQSGYPWILEVNTRPGFNLFRDHPDRSIYPKIVRNVKMIR